MAKKNKLSTPDWIREGYDSPEKYAESKGENIKKSKNSGSKTFTVRECPKCGSDDVGVVLGGKEGSGAKEWECHKCKWKGTEVIVKELTEDELMKYMDSKGEEIA